MSRLLRLEAAAVPAPHPVPASSAGSDAGPTPTDPLEYEAGAEGPEVFANLDGDYGYLSTGYYASLDAELAGLEVLPTTTEALDAYVVPIAMHKARLAGMAIPEFHIVTDRFPAPPLMAYPINPFSSKGEILLDSAAIEARRKGLTYTGKYAVLVQQLPADHRIDVVRCVLGQTLVPEYSLFAQATYEIFRLPLMRVRVIVTPKEFLLSAIEPLPYKKLTPDELALIGSMGTWQD